jgi:transposase
MKKATTISKRVKGKRYSEEFKVEALRLAQAVGVSKAAEQLGIYESQIYAWRTKAQYEASRSNEERSMAAEIAKLKRQLAERDDEVALLKKAAAYFAKAQK